MAGDAKRRFCAHYQLHVHNLLEMSASERSQLLRSSENSCVTYPIDSCGKLVFTEATNRAPSFIFDVCGSGAPANKYFENGSFATMRTQYCRYAVQVPTNLVLEDLDRSV